MKLADGSGYREEGGPGTSSPGVWTCRSAPLSTLIMKAWGLRRYQIGSDARLGRALYSIDARIPPGTSLHDFELMIQNLLTDRISLAVHHESAIRNVQELTVAAGVSKMKAAESAPAGAPLASKAKATVDVLIADSFSTAPSEK